MSLNWTNVKSLAIPVGGDSRDVKRVSIGGVTVWEKHSSPLPPGARWVEYLESTGTQYVDTGLKGGTSIDVEFSFKCSQSNSFVFGAREAWDNNGFSLNYASGYRAFNYGNYAMAWGLTSNVPIDANWHIVKIQRGGILTIDSWTNTVGEYTFSTPADLILFGAYSNTTTRALASEAFGYCKIWANGVLVRDLRPIAIGNTGYMLDMVSGQYLQYGNAGTGDFVVGPDVVPITWADNERYLNNGVVEAFTGLSRIDDYIPVVGGHSITWKWGDRVIGQAYMIVYNANKQVIDSWSSNSASGERTLNINATAAYVRYSVDPAFKETTFFKDNTTGEYAVRNGMAVV